MFFSRGEGRKCSKCGVHKGICVYIYTYIYMQICIDLPKSMEMF